MSTLGLVVEILREQARPMRVGEIVKAANGRLSAVTSSRRPRNVIKTELSLALRRGDRRFVCIAPGLFELGVVGNELVEPAVDPSLIGEAKSSPVVEGEQKRRRGGMSRKGSGRSAFVPPPRMLKLIEVTLRGYEWLTKPLWGPAAAQGVAVPSLAVGAEFGFWTVIEAPEVPNTQSKWKCRCMCGTVRAVSGQNLRSGASRSCQCPKFSWTPDAKKRLRAAWEENRKVMGLCRFCDNLAIEGRNRCTECLARACRRAKQRYNDRIANKQCPLCGKEPAVNRRFCQDCLYKDTANDFNVSVEEVARLRKLPCEVCGETERTVLDHDHVTGATRGVLCNGCNAALGFVKENTKTLQSLISYIQRYQVAKEAPLPTEELSL